MLPDGDGSGGGSYDTATPSPDILEMAGVVTREAAGSELWMDDVPEAPLEG